MLNIKMIANARRLKSFQSYLDLHIWSLRSIKGFQNGFKSFVSFLFSLHFSFLFHAQSRKILWIYWVLWLLFRFICVGSLAFDFILLLCFDRSSSFNNYFCWNSFHDSDKEVELLSHCLIPTWNFTYCFIIDYCERFSLPVNNNSFVYFESFFRFHSYCYISHVVFVFEKN